MKIGKLLLFSLLIVFGTLQLSSAMSSGDGLSDPYASHIVVSNDTIPLGERYDDYINNPSTNPFDLNDPSVIEKDVEYDPETGQYIITEKIGGEYYRMPTYMTFEEYLQYRADKQQQDYFNKLSGISSGESISGREDPIAKIDVKKDLLDRLFGGSTVDIRPQGNIDLTFGVDFQRVDNPILPERQRRQGGFDFDMNIQMSATGKIGEKLNLGFNYNTQATFDFDNQMKLEYNSDAFGEDEIIKKIEAGDVSLPLKGSLIQGSQRLFGVKTDLQFGRLRLTALAAQKKSQRNELEIQGGSQLQEFEVKADDYDENRHFFMSHYNRTVFEEALSNLPQINSLFKITKVEVWVTNDRNDTEDLRDIVALADLGESSVLTDPDLAPPGGPRNLDIFRINPLPSNDANDLYQDLIDRPNTRILENAVATLQSPPFTFQQTRDFEKVRARRLDLNEYTFHPDLGFVSVNVNLRPDQVLGVAYEYTYNGQVYKVGEFFDDAPKKNSQDTTKTNVLYVKLLKSTTQRIDVPAWDLMMKNVYSIGAFQVNQQDFKLDIFYEDPGGGEKRFLPRTNLQGQPLLRVFNLDKLNTQRDPIPDGIFDFVPGVTINPRNGRVMFPVLEPFGSALRSQIDNPGLAEVYSYQELYDSTLTRAREYPEKNRFTIRGSYKSSVSSEISLGAFNLPRGSVRVTAGGRVLDEGQDYEVDYNIGRLKILNDAILSSGVPIRVSFEDNTLFGFQTKTMLGLRADYEVSKNLNIGGTYMHLFERPFTQKVNIGDDPINNRVIGLDVNYSKEAPWLTKVVDAIPFIDTKEESTINFSAEAAFLKPSHSKAINQNDVDGERDKSGVVYVDDFEGSTSSFDLRTPANAWVLASVPQNDEFDNNPCFPEASLVDNTLSGVNRAKLNWYRIDQSVRESDPDNYSAAVSQLEVFPNLTQTPGLSNIIQSFDLTYDPELRGPYNYDVPDGGTEYSDGLDISGRLVNPASRWGGIMRSLNTNNFEAANVEYIEFWLLNPYMEKRDGTPISDPGELYFNLGNISEDILRDSRQFFENALPEEDPALNTDLTNWGRLPRNPPVTRAFDNDEDVRMAQDVGLDGLNNADERLTFNGFVDAIQSSSIPLARQQEILADVSNDDYLYYADDSFSDNAPIIDRYSKYNNQEGNSRSSGANGNNGRLSSATNIPDSEDLDRDNSLNEAESYFQYRIPLTADPSGTQLKLDDPDGFITDTINGPNNRIWYRFKVPLDLPDSHPYFKRVGGIQDFRTVRFIRMYLKEFTERTTLRFARLELVRNQWRRYRRGIAAPYTISPGGIDNTLFDVNAVNIEENSTRVPFGYVLPPGISREQSTNTTFPDILQNEQSLSIEACDLPGDGGGRGIYKIVNLDMRVFENMKMFVHAEETNLAGQVPIEDNEMSIFVRLGSDFESNYYEYELPLTLSRNLDIGVDDPEYREEVWRPENNVEILFNKLVEIKKQRNNDPSANLSDVYPARANNTRLDTAEYRIKGNPNLGLVKGVMIGIYNRGRTPHCAEIWVNELRVSGLDERGGMAALARLDMKLADFGNLTLSGNYTSIGWGQLEQKLAERAREEVLQYDLAASMELGKFFPEKSGIRIPFYAQYSKTTRTPEFDPYDLDVKLKDKIREAPNSRVRDSIKRQAVDLTEIKSYNFTNVRKERTKKGKTPMPWDIENFSASYGYTETNRRDPIVADDQLKTYQGSLDYNYSRKATYIQPFKKLFKKDKYLKLITEFNFNPLPNSFSFSTAMRRDFQRTEYRFAGDDPKFNTFYNKQFTWDRNYNLQWDLTKLIKISFNAVNNAVIDEPNESRILADVGIDDPVQYRKDSIWANIKNFGRTKNYNHNLTVNYTLPTKNIPFMDWVTIKAQYQGKYVWSAAALNVDSLGNVIQNGQNRQINGDFNFEQLYNKSKYLKKINSKNRKRKGKKGAKDEKGKAKKEKDVKASDKDKDGKDAKGKKKDKKKKNREPSMVERILIRPLMTLRKARVVYTEDFSTVVPGYMPGSRLFGQSSGFESPGWGFVSGLQPDQDWFDRAADRDNNFANPWITRSVFLNQQVFQNYTSNFSGKVTLEPFNDFRVELEATRQYTENYSEFFKDTLLDNQTNIVSSIPREVGSFTMSYFALQTLFDSDIEAVFDRFKANRAIISQRLGIEEGIHVLDSFPYKDGYGRFNNDVLMPAFIAAYTNKDPNTIAIAEDYTTVLFDWKKNLPRLNWRLTYNGLSKLPWFKERVQSVSLTHGYRSTLTVNNFNTDLDFQVDEPELRNETTGNYYSRFEIPNIVIQEAFTPLLGIDVRLKNDMSFRVDFKKSRNLSLSFVDFQLAETKTSEYVVGFGYRMKNVVIPFLQPKNKRKKKKKKKKIINSGKPQDPKDPKAKKEKGSDLNFKFDFSFRDDITINHQLDTSIPPVSTRGAKTIRISPSVDYDINKRLNMRLFFDRSQTIPANSISFPITNTQAGVTIRFKLD